MKRFKSFSTILFLSSLILLLLVGVSCDENSSNSTDPIDDIPIKGLNAVFSSTNGGTLKTSNGVEITVIDGAIAYQKDGTLGEVSFTLEPNISESDLPKPIPADFKLIGSVSKFGPEKFVFNLPVQIMLPAGSESSPQGLAIIRYNDVKNKWVILPVNTIDAVGKRIGASVFELCYFAVVKVQAVSKIRKSEDEIQDPEPTWLRVGGLRYKHNMANYYVTMTVKAVTYKYPDVPWTNEIGDSGTNGTSSSGVPNPTTYLANIPQGDYLIEVSRAKRGTQFELPGKTETYSVIIPVTVTPYAKVETTWDEWDWLGWTDLDVKGGEWRTGDPSTWPPETTPENITASLIANYPFSGNANDVSGNNHNGTVYGATLTDDRFGNSNSAYSFNENDNAIKAYLGKYSSISVSLWYNSPGTFNYHYPNLFQYSNRDANMNVLSAFGITLLGNNSAYAGKEGSVYFSLITANGAGQNGAIQTSTIPSFNTWHHVCAIYNIPKRSTKLFLDNKLIGTNTCSFNLQADTVYIGSQFDHVTPKNSSFKGKIDDIKIYNGAIDESKVKELFEEKK